MMNSTITASLQKCIEELQAKKALLLTAKDSIITSKFNAKREQNMDANKELDNALAQYIKEKQEEFNKAIADIKVQIAQKKADLDTKAMAEARRETDEETASQIAEYDKAIQALRAQIGGANEASEGKVKNNDKVSKLKEE